MAEHKIDGNNGAGNVDLIEQSTKRQHFTDVRYVTVRWEPYKPDGARQMKAKGRWQEQVGSGDYFRWANCDRPAFAHDPETIEDLRAQLAAANARAENYNLFVEALSEIKATVDGQSDQSVKSIIDAVLFTIHENAAYQERHLALRDKPAVTVQEAARVLLAVHDGFMDGEPYDKTEADRLFLSASFGAQAFAICPQPEARPSAMLRAFLLALIDPTDPQLDYLRAKNVVRAIAASEA